MRGIRSLRSRLDHRFNGRVTHLDVSRRGRILVIGDVHGCIRELHTLLEKLALTSDDTVVFVGDVIGKGPDSASVLTLLTGSSNMLSVLGNAEAEYLQGASVPRVDEEYREWVGTWPLAVTWRDRVVVHAGIDPWRPISRHRPSDLYTIRSLDEPGAYQAPYWFEQYRGDESILFGHTVSIRPIRAPRAVGLDTGCVYGGALTAYDTAADTFTRIPARSRYARRPRKAWYRGGIGVSLAV